MANKAHERSLLEIARRQYPWFPPGEIVDNEKPDFLLIDGEHRTGIEVTQLFQPPKHGSRFPPHEVSRFHQRVMATAEHLSQTLRPLDVLVYFSYRHHMNDPDGSARALVEFVRSHAAGTYQMSDGIPHGFSVVRIAEPLANQVPRWRCLDSGETLLVTHEMLDGIIRRKNRRVRTYVEKVDRVWLLIGSSFAQFASNFSVPQDVVNWSFDFEFDRVLLLSSEGSVFNLQRRGSIS